ncbi:alpha/beta family hydrolase [Microbacterium sp. CFBP9034]|uniref:alpha/beta hydrolase family protein n=1 Tax=Microbacterium sp. CFBP9034 TaxID=3096540 RepID=UPI002A69ACF1|nr:alpha/beta family hydrolase [Microbacterium sp. CFBP9034]MDY0909303.1 alpha/beta family hydrolase [Microbacterium sp. CFBP9034]
MAELEADLRIPLELPSGTVEVAAALGRPDDAWAVLAVAHGAGAGHRHPFFSGFVGALHTCGVATLRFDFPYVTAGRRMPGPAAHAISTWAAVEAEAASRVPDLALWASGKSYGGRMASMAAAEGRISPAGLIYLGYPLHPPGDPAKARTAHLPDVAPPQLFVEGTNDPFIAPREQLEEAVASCRQAEILWIEGGGHSFEIKGRKRSSEEIGAELAPLVAEWMRLRS